MPSVLVVDDDPMVNRRLQHDFEDLDVQVLIADTSMAGLEIICRQKPDVVVLDVMLPDLSGLETFQRIHQSHPKIPVIFITASGESDTAIEAMKLGAYDYLLKPLELNLHHLWEQMLSHH